MQLIIIAQLPAAYAELNHPKRITAYHNTHLSPPAAFIYGTQALIFVASIFIIHIAIGRDNNVGHYSESHRLSRDLLVRIAAHYAMLA